MNYFRQFLRNLKYSFKSQRTPQRRGIQRPARMEPLEVRVMHAGEFTDIGSAGITGVQGGSVSWGDYDSDGDLDAAVGGWSNTFTTTIYQNDGNGNFTNINAGIAGSAGGSVDWGDYDNDGQLDLLVTGPGATIYHNDGNGVFTDINAGLTSVFSSAAAWGDYDNDGLLDIVIAGNVGGYSTTIYHNEGDGTFAAINAGLTGMAYGSVAWGDYDSDGALDLVVNGRSDSSNYTTKLYHNDGDGDFTEISAGLAETSGGVLAWSDYDNDGDLDLAVSGVTSSGRTTTVYRNDGSGTFTDIAAGLVGINDGTVSWGDFDNDGLLDLFVNGNSSGGLVANVYHNDGNDTFTDINAGLTTANWTTSAWGDYDGDADLDILFTGNNGSAIARLYRNNETTANTAPAAPTSLTSTVMSPTSVKFSWSAATDTETASPGLSYNLRVGTTPGGSDVFSSMSDASNGGRSVAAAGPIQGTSYTLTGLTQGVTYYWSVQAIDTGLMGGAFASEQFRVLNPFTDRGNLGIENLAQASVAWGDYDNDGDQDAVVTGYGSSGPVTKIYENDGAGNFTDINAGLVGVTYGSAQWGDYDNDGKLDLVVTGSTTNAPVAVIYHNDGNGVFTDINAGLVGVDVSTAAWGDYNNDGKLDLLIAGTLINQRITYLYRNDGDGAFTDTHATLPGIHLGTAAWGDYDNDGYLDIALTGQISGSLNGIAQVYHNEGDGTFTNINLRTSDNNFGSIAWGDYDNDGDLDLALSGISSSPGPAFQPHTTIYRNDGNGVFTDIVAGLHGATSSDLAWGDYDNDGKLDLIVSGWDSNNIFGSSQAWVYRNTGNDTFVDIDAGLTGVYQSSTTWSDIDNDGDLDIMLIGQDTSLPQSTTVYRSNSVTANTAPDAPTGLTSTAASTSSITFSWTAATDDETASAGLSYNLRVGTTPGGSDVFSTMANSTNGGRRIAALGPIQDTSYTLTGLSPDVTYYWSVQAVDAGLVGGAFASGQSRTLQFTDPGNLGMTGAYQGAVAWGDYDADGDLDALVAGLDVNDEPIAKIYENDGNGGFTDINAGLTGVAYSAVAWGDYDNDGKLDLVITGVDEDYYVSSKLYHNDGNDTFTEVNAGLVDVMAGAVAWGDYNNDGKLDLFLSGLDDDSDPVAILYHNNGNGTFTDTNTDLDGAIFGSASWADYDNDGKLDLTYTGISGSGYSTLIYHNDGNGDFTEIQAGIGGVTRSTMTWGDYDNDGDLDLALQGIRYGSPRARIYRNDGDGDFTNIMAGLTASADGGIAWGDYNNDGDLDLLLTGFDGTDLFAKVYRNEGTDTFTDIAAGLDDADYSSGAWGDYDADGKLDLLLAGLGRAGTPFVKVYDNFNATANGAPTAPTTLAASAAVLSTAAGTININRNAQAGRYIQSSMGSGTSQIIFSDARATATNGAPSTLGSQVSVNLVNTASNRASSTVASVTVDGAGNYTVTINLRDDGTNSTATLADIQAAIAAHAGAAALLSVSATAVGGFGTANTSNVYGSSSGAQQLIGGQDTANNDLVFTDVRPLATRDDFDVAVALNATAANQTLGITVDTDTFGNKTINVNLATDAQGRVTTTAAQLKTFFDTNVGAGATAARALLSIAVAGNGSGTLAAASETALPIAYSTSAITFAWTAATDAETPSDGLSYNLRVGTTPGGSDVFSTMADATNGTRRVAASGPIQGISYTLTGLTSGVTYYWSVQAIDTGFAGGAFAAEQSIALNTAPVVVAQDFLIGENSINGAFIGTIVSSDVDVGQTRTFAITAGNTNNAFAIHPTTGVLTVNNTAALNYETIQQFNLTVTVTDNGTPTRLDSAAVKVFLRNENDAPVVVPTQFLIGENSVNNAFIGAIPATDQDAGQTRTYSIVAGNLDNAFSINAATGVLYVNNSAALDYETIQRFDLVVRVVDNGVPAAAGAATVTVFLRNENDAPVVLATQFLIGENSINNAFIGNIPATDQDAGQTKIYSIIAGNLDNAFAINATTGVLTVNNSAALNYEAIQRFDLTIRVVDTGNPAAAGAAVATVFLRNENDAPVIIPQDFQISENSANNAFIWTIGATDQDPGQTRTFAITGGNTDNAFAIHATTGVLTVNNSAALNFETTPQFHLTITATDNGSPSQSGSASMTVFLRDINEAPTVIPQDFLIGEDSVNNAFIGVIAASDPDAGQTKTFAITAGNTNNAFSIEPTTGIFRVNNSVALDFETTPQFHLTITVTDSASPAKSTSVPVTVYLRNVVGARAATFSDEDTTTIVLPTEEMSSMSLTLDEALFSGKAARARRRA